MTQDKPLSIDDAAIMEPPYDPVVIAEALLNDLYGEAGYEPSDLEEAANDMNLAIKAVIFGFCRGYASEVRKKS